MPVFRFLLVGALFFVKLLSPFHALSQVSFSSSNLPIVVINTNNKQITDEPKIIADMGIIDNGAAELNHVSGPFNDYEGKIGIEIRGSSSQMFPKKQYGIELRNEDGTDLNASLLGLPEEEDWILFAPYNDKSLMRDVLAYKLGRDLGHYAPRTKYCELVLNGNYQGVYVLIEKIKRDKNRLDINKLKEDEIAGDDLTGGYLLKIDKFTGGGGDGWASEHAPPAAQAGQSIFFQYEVPKADEIVAEQKEYIQNYIRDFENALAGENFKDPQEGYAAYIDINSFIDFFIANEVSKNVDGYRLSTFLHKQRGSDGGKLFMGPIWDFNLAFGNADYCTKGNPEGLVISFNATCPEDPWLIPFWWKRLLEDEDFQLRLTRRWQELRNGPLETATLHTYIDSVANVLKVNDAQKRNFQQWPVLGQYVWPNYYVGNTFQQEVDWLKSWISQRMSWLDTTIPFLPTGVSQSSNEGLFSLSLFPVPFQESLFLEYHIEKAGKVQISWHDAYGRKMATEEQEQFTVGLHTNEINTTFIPPGMYFLKIRFPDGSSISKKVVKR